ncbi:hypothetical protein JCM10449v2_002404 [Rhodotorula kratochvilovae]
MATTAPSLLPPYIPSPAFSSSFQTSALLSSADTTPLGASSPASDYFGDAATAHTTPSPATPRSATTAPPHTFFGRLRSSSLHSSHPAMVRACDTPPSTFSGPSTPSSMSASSGGDYLSSSLHSSTSTAPSSVFPSPGDAPFIKAVTVPHHSGSGKHCLFACRVVPEIDVVSPPVEPRERVHSRRESLGKMRMAGTGEPHTVWRSWQECLDFSASLSAAFPDNRPESPSSTATFPSTHHKVPRLHSKKLANLFKSSSLNERQAELESFCAQLFHMPPTVRHSCLVRNFFRIRPQDALSLNCASLVSPPSLGASEPSSEVPASVPDWLVAGNLENDLDLVDATIRAPRQRPARPALAIKTSSPDLRGSVRGWAGEDLHVPSPLASMSVVPRTSDFLRPRLSSGASTLVQNHVGDPSTLSTATSSRTITPIPSSSRAATPSGSTGLAKTLRKKASGGLRHIRSLGDLRGNSRKAETPDEPVPSLSPAAIAAAVSSFAMDRAATQPLPDSTPVAPTPPLPATYSQRRPSAPALSSLGRLPPMPNSAPVQSRHRRNGSSQSSTSSFEELWGTPFPTAFRQTPSGRLECVREPQNGVRRPSLSTSAIRPPGAPQQIPTRPPMFRHKQTPSSASISSLDSARSGGSSRSSRSMAMSLSRSSAGSEMCPTPPTPNAEWGANAAHGEKAERIVAGKFYVENGVLHENNTVPPPPFFPVPPLMQFAYSHDGLPHTPRSSGSSVRATHARKSSGEPQYPPTPRSRTGSTASSRRVPLHGQGSLDPILASPVPSSAASSPRTAGGSRTSWTFKLLHQDENVILRVSKPVDGSPVALERLRADIQAKFLACGVVLPGAGEQGEWGLAWTTRESGVATGTKLIIAQEDLDACLRAHDESAISAGKIVLKVIC